MVCILRGERRRGERLCKDRGEEDCLSLVSSAGVLGGGLGGYGRNRGLHHHRLGGINYTRNMV